MKDAAVKGAASSPAVREFSAKARERIAWLYTRYPLHAEEEFGVVDAAAVDCVAREMKLSAGYVFGVLTFYTHYRREGDGKYLLQVCSTLPCALRGCREVVAHLEERLGVKPGETTPDGKFTLKKVECLASCDTAPVVQVNDDYHESLTIEKLDRLLDSLQ